MKTDKTKLLKDIEAMKEKLASMEKELNKVEEFKHFPSGGDKYYFYNSMGIVGNNTTSKDELKVNVFKSKEEAEKAYNKAVALEKVKRKLLELQGDWKPDWTDEMEEKFFINYDHNDCCFKPDCRYRIQYDTSIPYIKTNDIANTIIKEMEDELKLIFDIAI